MMVTEEKIKDEIDRATTALTISNEIERFAELMDIVNSMCGRIY